MEITNYTSDNEWKQEFIRLSELIAKKFSNLNNYIDVYSEAYLYLLEYYVTKGLILPNKNTQENIRCFYVSAKRFILRKIRSLKLKQKRETMTEFDEELDIDIIDKNTEEFVDDVLDKETDLPRRIEQLLNSEHKENRQLGLFAKCLIDSQAAGLSRKEALDVTQKIMNIGVARCYELQNQLAEYLEYKSGKYKRKLPT